MIKLSVSISVSIYILLLALYLWRTLGNTADFQTRKITTDKIRHCIMTNGSIYQEEKTILNLYAPNNRGLKCMKQNWKY